MSARTIPLTKGYSTVVDEADYEALSALSWHARITPQGKVYACRSVRAGPRTIVQRMHRLLVGEPVGLDVDHIDGDSLNNRRANLRPATRSQNLANARKGRRGPTPYKGVGRVHRSATWQARCAGAYLGAYPTELEAAAAYDKAARARFGEFARTNGVGA